MSADRLVNALDFGTGTSTGHQDGVRWIDYQNISWNPVFCKRCDICVDICPKGTLVLRDDAILEEDNCILCGLCERYCPDLAIEMIPSAIAAYAAAGGADSAAGGADSASRPDVAAGPGDEG